MPKINWQKFKIDLINPLALSHGTYSYRHTFIVTVEKDGQTGFGEATAILYYDWTVEKLEKHLNVLSERSDNFVKLDGNGKIQMTENIDQLIPPIVCALDCAIWDVNAKLENKTVRSILPIKKTQKKSKNLISSWTVSGSNAKEIDAGIKATDWPLIKIKMGSTFDNEIIEVMKKHPNKKFRIDANAGWTMDWIVENIAELHTVNIEMFEQPFPTDKNQWNLELKKLTDIPIIADESFQSLEDLVKIENYFDGINIKLMKCGGISGAIEILNTVNNLQIMVGCMTESSIGISAICQLLEYVDYCDVDGANLILNNPAKGVRVEKGVIEFLDQAGTGAALIN